MDATHVSYVSAYTSRRQRREELQKLSRRRFLKRLGLALAGVSVPGVLLAEEAGAGATGNRICRVGRRYLGVPYVLGGTSLRYGLDCDAYVKRVMAKCGIYVPWVPTVNGPDGRRRRGALRVGDVVFFSRPYHVGIYSGGGYVLHASSYFKKVVESELFYLQRDLVYLGARAYR
jgi:cell wall-associated NlpC family hydrolase